MVKKRLTRRDFLFSGALAFGAATLVGCTDLDISPLSSPSSTPSSTLVPPPTPTSVPTPTFVPPTPQIQHVLRIAHLTDMHVLPQPEATKGFALALRHAQQLNPQPDLILNTGDCIMDSLKASKDDTLSQWRAFREVLDAECSIPVIHCIGNHDVWGWGLDDTTIQSDGLYGKGMALQQLELASRYFSYDQAGWHFIVLDSTHPQIIQGNDIPYTGKLDEEQYLWFEKDIQDTPPNMPICIVSHIPILAACEYFDGPNEESGNWIVPGAWMHIDARKMRSIFLEHRNVCLSLSGHTHQHERLEYLGVKYLTNGAVSGNWWGGIYMDFPPAYVVVDLFSDGSSEHTFIAYDQL